MNFFPEFYPDMFNHITAQTLLLLLDLVIPVEFNDILSQSSMENVTFIAQMFELLPLKLSNCSPSAVTCEKLYALATYGSKF